MALPSLETTKQHELLPAHLCTQKTDNRALSPKYCRTLSYGMRNLFWSYTPAKCHKCYEKSVKWLSAHVCLDMLCFCILKRIGIATLFSQLWILNNFEKKIIKKYWKILDFRELYIFLKIFKILKKSRKNLRFFLLKIIWKIKNFENFEKSKKSKIFDFQYDFQ